MKRFTVLMAAAVLTLCGCGPKPVELNPLDIDLYTEAESPFIRWQKPEGESLYYQIVLQGISGKDGGRDVTLIGLETVEEPSYSGINRIAWYAQEHDYYGWMRYQVTAVDGEKSIAQGVSESFLIADYYPSEKELKPDLDQMTYVSYSGSGEQAEDNFSFFVTKEESGWELYANYINEDGNHDIKEAVTESQIKELKELLAEGTVVRRTVSDPDLVMLDGSETSWQLNWEGSPKMIGWYDYLPASGKEMVLDQWFRETGKEKE